MQKNRIRCRVNKISVITVCLNAEQTIEMTMKSVAGQKHGDIEHVIIDGGSKDKTLDIISQYNPSIIVSEPDRGIYHAMEKGVKFATGDAVFFLNSGDIFHSPNVISDVVKFFNEHKADAVFGNLMPVYLNLEDSHDHAAFIANKMIDLSYFSNRRLFYNESIHHQTIFYRSYILNTCSFISENEDANGEYYLNAQAFIENAYVAKHVRIPICDFALGGQSTKNFSAEWTRFTLARDFIRKRFFPNGPNVPRDGAMEYLTSVPPLRSLVRIALHEIHLLDFVTSMRNKVRRIRGA